METTIERSRVTRLRNKLRREIAGNKWTLSGTEFSRFEWLGLNGDWKFGVWFYCNLKRVRVHIYGDNAFDLPDWDKTFKGENAWDECIEQTVNKLIEMTNAVQQGKEKSYAEAYNNYFRKVFKGE